MLEKLLVRPDAGLILANMSLPVLLLDDENIITFANDAAEHFFGRSRKKLEGIQADEILRFSDPRMERLLENAEGDIGAQDIEIDTANGPANADISVTKLMDVQDWRLMVVSPRHAGRAHIGERDDAGSRQAMGAPAILGHEIKNPLAGIRGAAQLLAKRVEESAHPLTDLIINEVDRIARLLDQMQNLGNPTPSNLAAVNIHQVIEHAIRSIRAANGTLPAISIDYDPSLPDVFVDQDAMVQILINLIQNAVDILDNIDDSEISITTKFILSGELRDSGEDRRSIKLPVVITISDNGSGVSDSIKDELFAPFVTSKREGQGLGLAIVRKLINQMNSRVIYERDSSKGITHFRLFLPVASKGDSG